MHIHPMRIPAAAVFLALGVLSALPARAQGLAPSVPVEVFVGKMEFDEDLRLPDQELAGVRLGLDLARYVGVRGFYWRAVNDERDGWAPLQSYGAEAQVNLNAGNGLTPFLVGGIGRVDFMDGYVDLDSVQPDDQTALIAGGGLRLDVGRVGIVAAARSYLFENEDEEGDDLISNLQYTAGLAFRLGRSGRRAQVAPVPPQVIRETRDTVYVSRDPEGRVRERDEDAQGFVTIPIPREGEIYLRYGPADSTARRAPTGAPTEADLEAIRARLVADLQPVLRQLLEGERAEIREMIREELDRLPATALTAEAEQRLLENLEARLALRLRDEMGRPVADTAGGVPVARPAEPRASGFEPRMREWRPYFGGSVDDPTQFVLGTRLDLGPLDASNPALRIVPDASIGFGSGTASVMIAAYAQYDLAPVEVLGRAIVPYGYAGPGVLFFGDPPVGKAKTEAVLNLGYGFSAALPGRLDGPRFFLEHQGIDLFDLNRVLVGLRF